MKNGRKRYGARCRVRWSAAIALGALVILAPSLAWSQESGRPEGFIPLPQPGGELNKLKLTTYSPPSWTLGSFDGFRNFIPLPHPGNELNKLKLTTYGSPFDTVGSFDGARNFIPLPQPGGELNKLKLTTYGSEDGEIGSFVLRRFVMVAFP